MSSVENTAGILLKKHRFLTLFLVLLSPLPFFLVPASAAIPQTVNYQGFLLSKITNLPVETPQSLKFVFYDAATSGNLLFSENLCNVPVSKGRYEVEVGAQSGGIPAAVFISSANRWMEIQVSPSCAGTYEAMSPRIHLQASPYSFNSLYASTAAAATSVFTANVISAAAQTDNGAITISTNLFVMGGISVGNISPGQMLSVAGMVESKGDPLTCIASQTCGYKFPDGSIQTVAAADTMWKINGNNMYTLNTGNVGIGESVANPLARLHISTAAGEAGDILLVSTGASNMFRVNGLGQVYGGSYFGNGATLSGVVTKAGDTMTGQLTLSGSSLTVTSSNGVSAPKITLQSNVYISSEASSGVGGGLRVSSNVYVVGFSSAVKYYGDGSSLTSVTTTDITKVIKTGDTMTGQLTLLNSTLTVTGAAFSVTGSTFSVSGGSVAVGGLTYPARLSVTGGIIASSSITAQAGLYSNFLVSTGITASSASFSNSGPANYSINTASGIFVNAGAVSAPYFIGNGSELLNVAGTDITRVLKAGDTMTGNLLVSGSSITVLGPIGGGYSLTVATAAAVNAYSLAIDGTGNVGVQVSNPSAPLEVYKQIQVSNALGLGGDTSLSMLASGGGETYMNWAENSLIASGGAAQGALGFSSVSRDFVYRAGGTSPGAGGQEVFRISAGAAGANWKFGIGTTNANPPLERFHVRTNVLVSTSGFVSPILFISTTSGTVSISTVAQNYALTVNGGIMAVSSVTAQGGFFGDGSGITNLTQGALQMSVSSIAARADSPYGAVVFTSDTYVNARLAVGQVFTPLSDLHVRGVVTLDNKVADDVVLNFFPHDGGAAYMNWNEGATPNKGTLGMPSSKRDLVFTINTVNEEVFRIKGNSSFGGGSGWQFGVGTPNPLASFHVATNFLVSTAAVSPVLFISTAQGAVGIWTNTPAERFNVASSMLVGSKASPLIFASTGTGFTGVGTAGPRAMLEVGDGNLLAAGTNTGAAVLPVTGAGSRLMWMPSASAIRAGYVVGTEWDTVGLYSVAFGDQNSATATGSTVSGGFFNAASGIYSAISGGRNNIVQGQSSIVTAGENNYLTGKNSIIAGGEYNTVLSPDAFVGGRNGYLDSAAQGTFAWGYDDTNGNGYLTNTFKVTAPYVFLVDPADVHHYNVGIRTPSPQAALDVNGNAQFGSGVTKSTFTADGFWLPRSMLSGDLAALTPSALGEVVLNSSINDLCVSTGTVLAGQWAEVGTKGTGHCY